MLMDIIPLDATLIKGSHGRKPEDPADGAIILSKNTHLLPEKTVEATAVFDVIMAHLKG